MQDLSEKLKTEEFIKKIKSIAAYPEQVPELIRSFKAEIKSKSHLQKYSSDKLIDCLCSAAKAGVTFGPPNNECYIFPRAGSVSLYISYKGLIKMAYQSKLIKSMTVDIAYEGDTFEIKNGSTPSINHIPNINRMGDEKPLAYYAVAKLTEGETLIAYIPEKVMDIKHRKPARLQAKGNAMAPWIAQDEAMCKKTVIKKLLSPLPILKNFTDAEHEEYESAEGQNEG